LRPTLKRIDLYVIRWARRKFKRLRRKTKGSRDWFDRLRRADPKASKPNAWSNDWRTLDMTWRSHP
jgi:hypothetical protein